MVNLVLKGVVVTGFKEGAFFTQKEFYKKGFKKKLGYEPWPGTLNIEVDSEINLNDLTPIVIPGFKEKERTFGSLRCYPCIINNANLPITDCEPYPHPKGCGITGSHYSRQICDLEKGRTKVRGITPPTFFNNQKIKAHLLVPAINKHNKNILEIISPLNLRETLSLKDKDALHLSIGESIE